MQKNKVGNVGENAEVETSASREITYDQPNEQVHAYVSSEPKGYEVLVNDDKRTWTVQFEGKVITADAKSRMLAFEAANSHRNPESAQSGAGGAKGAVKASKPLVNKREHAVLKVLVEAEGQNVQSAVIAEKTGLEQAVVFATIAQLSRKKFLQLTGDGSALSPGGRAAFETYIERPGNVAREPKKPRDPEASRKARQAKMEAKHGVKDPNIGPMPTRLEFEQARHDNAAESYKFALVVQRRYPYSPDAKKKVESSKGRLDIAKARLEALTASGKGDQVAEAIEAEAVVVTSE